MSKIRDMLFFLSMVLLLVAGVLFMLPYLLWNAWGHIIPLKGEAKGAVLALKGSEQ